MFPVYGGKRFSSKAVHNWVQKSGKRFADDEEVETEVAETTAKRLLRCRFRRNDKPKGQVHQR
jgi:hypothetical protein